MAFVDALVAECDAQVTPVDRHGKPGGHWNDAYPFVTPHQPSAFCGVDSMELGRGSAASDPGARQRTGASSTGLARATTALA